MMQLAAPWLARLADGLVGGDDREGVLERWADTIRRDGHVADAIYRSAFQTELAGQLMVREVEAPETLPASRSRLSARAPGDAFLALPFEDALELFREKELIVREEFDALRDRYKRGGFIATGLAGDALKERARAAIERNLASGASLQDTIAQIRAAELELGIEPASHAYLDTVVRTNVAVAYGAGRYRAMTDPAVLAARPYWRYLAVHDSRTREEHLALDGTVVEAGSAEAARISPPNGYLCRCAWQTLSAGQLEAMGLSVVDETGFVPDAGWGGAPDVLAD